MFFRYPIEGSQRFVQLALRLEDFRATDLGLYIAGQH